MEDCLMRLAEARHAFFITVVFGNTDSDHYFDRIVGSLIRCYPR